jgi:chaperonin GroEL
LKTHITDAENTLGIILSGVQKLYNAVSATMGPRGAHVIIRKAGGRTFVTRDGVTVAKGFSIPGNPTEDVASDLVREAASRLDATTGDGTTTVTVLTYHILKNAAELIDSGENAMKIKLALDAITETIVSKIKEHTNYDVTEKELIAVATISSGDVAIGEAVGKTIFEAGKDTPIMLGFSGDADTTTSIIDGFKINSGPASPYLLEGAGLRLEMDNPKIIVVDAKLREKNDVLPLLQQINDLPPEEKKLLLVCSEIAGDALSLLVVNRLKGFAEIAVARVPEDIQGKSEYLADLAMAVGAKVLARNTGNSIANPSLKHFGSAQKVTVELAETVIVGGRSVPEDLESHIASLEEAKTSKKASVRAFAESRLKTLEQKIVSIHVGGLTEAEAQNNHYRYEDAVGAARAALRGGVVPGGGTLLYSIGGELDDDVLGAALGEPLAQVLWNAGIEVPDGVKPGKGIDVMHPEDGVIDLVKRGILDPAESEIECVRTAVSVAGLLMTSAAMIVDEKEPQVEAEQFPRFN